MRRCTCGTNPWPKTIGDYAPCPIHEVTNDFDLKGEAREQGAAAFEPWPLSSKWWLSFRSVPHLPHKSFDDIVVTLDSGDYAREVTRIMVPKIDGLVCQSHSIISYLINQNLEAVKDCHAKVIADNDNLRRQVSIYEKALEAIKEIEEHLGGNSELLSDVRAALEEGRK